MPNRVPKVFKAYHTEEVEYICPIDEADFERARFDGTTRLSSWIPILVARISEEPGRRYICGDLPSSSLGDLVLNRRAKDAIGASLERYGEMLPLLCNDGEFWTLNVTCILDALDESKSVALKSSEEGRLLAISKYVFRADALCNAFLFKIPQNRQGRPLMTTPFVELIKSSGLTGLTFKQIWAPD